MHSRCHKWLVGALFVVMISAAGCSSSPGFSSSVPNTPSSTMWAPPLTSGWYGASALETRIINALAYDSHSKSVRYDATANRVDIQIFTAGSTLSDEYLEEMRQRAAAVAAGASVFITAIDGELKPA